MFRRRSPYGRRFESNGSRRRYFWSKDSYHSRNDRRDVEQTWLIVDEYHAEEEPAPIKSSHINEGQLEISSVDLGGVSQDPEGTSLFIGDRNVCGSILYDTSIANEIAGNGDQSSVVGSTSEKSSGNSIVGDAQVELAKQELKDINHISLAEATTVGDGTADPSALGKVFPDFKAPNLAAPCLCGSLPDIGSLATSVEDINNGISNPQNSCECCNDGNRESLLICKNVQQITPIEQCLTLFDASPALPTKVLELQEVNIKSGVLPCKKADVSNGQDAVACRGSSYVSGSSSNQPSTVKGSGQQESSRSSKADATPGLKSSPGRSHSSKSRSNSSHGHRKNESKESSKKSDTHGTVRKGGPDSKRRTLEHVSSRAGNLSSCGKPSGARTAPKIDGTSNRDEVPSRRPHRVPKRSSAKDASEAHTELREKRSKTSESDDVLAGHFNPWLMEDEEQSPTVCDAAAASFKDMSSMYVDATFEAIGDEKLDLKVASSSVGSEKETKINSSSKGSGVCPMCLLKTHKCYCDPYPEPSYSASKLQDVQLRPFKAEHSGAWACPLVTCQVTLSDRGDLVRHVAEAHQGYRISFLCEYCDTVLPHRKSYSAHVEDKHPSRFSKYNFHATLVCLVTEEQFVDLLENDCSRGFRCKVQGCPEEFPSRHALFSHRKDVHPVSCLVCAESFCDELTMAEHTQSKHEASLSPASASPLDRYPSDPAPPNESDAVMGEISMIARDPEDLKGEDKLPFSSHLGKLKCLKNNGKCGEIFNSGLELYLHIVEAHNSRFVSYACGICGKNFLRLDLLMWHVKQSHGDRALEFLATFAGASVGPMHGIRQPSSAYPCLYPRCRAVFTSTRMFTRHFVAVHGYQCHKCFETFVTQDLLESHALEKKHAHICYICHSRPIFPSKVLLLEHSNRVHRFVPKQPVSVLDPGSSKVYGLASELFSYNSQGALVCQINTCFRSYSKSLAMYRHFVMAHQLDATAYSCPFCEKLYHNRFLVLWHVKLDHPARAMAFRMEMSRDVFGPVKEIVPGDATYPCLFLGCTESFRSYQDMRHHLSVHRCNRDL